MTKLNTPATAKAARIHFTDCGQHSNLPRSNDHKDLLSDCQYCDGCGYFYKLPMVAAQKSFPGSLPTPTPWHANGTQIIGPNGKRLNYVADVSRDNGAMIAQANAALIVEAVNEHSALLAVAESAERALSYAKDSGLELGNLRAMLANLAAVRGQK